MTNRTTHLVLLSMLIVGVPSSASASICDEPGADWLMCEDFEGGGAGWSDWFASSGFVECRGCSDGMNDPDRLFLSNDPEHAFEGSWGLHMPATAAANFRGAELLYYDCDGDRRAGCTLNNHEQLYLRTRVRLAADHEYVHHFLSIGGTRSDNFWEGSGTAGCRPDGVQHAGTTLDFDRDRHLWFYTYHPDMRCDSGGYCSGDFVQNICDGCAGRGLPCESGPECCWGNRFEAPSPVVMPRDEWVCLELMMQINTPGANDGEMAFWVNDTLAHRETGMRWRDVAELGLNRANMSHYIANGDADQPNRVSFDDFIVSTSRIGCDVSPTPAADAGVVSDAGVARDGGVTTSPDASFPASDSSASFDAATGGDGGTGTASGGCSVTPTTPPSGPWFVGLLAGLWTLRRRRREPDFTSGSTRRRHARSRRDETESPRGTRRPAP